MDNIIILTYIFVGVIIGALVTWVLIQLNSLEQSKKTTPEILSKKSIDDFKVPQALMAMKFDFWYNTELLPYLIEGKTVTKAQIEKVHDKFAKDTIGTLYNGLLKELKNKYFNKSDEALKIYLKQYFYNRLHQKEGNIINSTPSIKNINV